MAVPDTAVHLEEGRALVDQASEADIAGIMGYPDDLGALEDQRYLRDPWSLDA